MLTRLSHMVAQMQDQEKAVTLMVDEIKPPFLLQGRLCLWFCWITIHCCSRIHDAESALPTEDVVRVLPVDKIDAEALHQFL